MGVVADPKHGECPVFKCDECIVDWEVEGEKFPIAYTFDVSPAGQPVELGNDPW